MRYFSMFTGIGGFELGIQRAYDLYKTEGQEPGRDPQDLQRPNESPIRAEPLCVGYSEIDKYAIKVFERWYRDAKNYGDATKIDPRQLPEFELLVGGFPCQAFSVAGKRKGFDDTRGTLFFDIARVLQYKRPRHILLENVKGLLSHQDGETFQTILRVLTDLGYHVEWQLLNSKDFGVPQNRERVLIVGHLGGRCRSQVFPIGSVDSEAPFGTVKSVYHKGQTTGSYVAETRVGTLRTHKDGRGFREVKSGLAPTIPARARQDGSGQPVVAIPVLTPDRMEKRQNGRRFKTDGEPQFTLNTQDRHGIFDGAKIRRLTPVECERLQGFMDGWTERGDFVGGVRETISDTQRYKMCGNAVTVNVISAVMGGYYAMSEFELQNQTVGEQLTHAKCVEYAARYLDKRCKAVFPEFFTHNAEIPDVIGFTNGGVIRDGMWYSGITSTLIEVKVSRSDFLADRKKSFRMRPEKGMGDYRYYCCPKGMIKKEELPEGWGLLYVYPNGQVRSIEGSSLHNKDRDCELYLLFYYARRAAFAGVHKTILEYRGFDT